MTRVVVVGSVNLDLVVATRHIPAPGETIIGSDVVYRPGGKGGNQAVAARRLGTDTTLIAVVGDDHFGSELRTSLGAEGLDLSHLDTAQGVATGVALVVVADDGENSIVVSPGANGSLDDTRLARLPEVLDAPGVLSLQIEVPLATSLHAASTARKVGTTVLLNAAPLPRLPNALLDKLLGAVDVIVVNELEALQLTGGGDAPKGLPEWSALATELCQLGPSMVVITLGSQGAVASDGHRTYTQPAFSVDVVDTTGAGDSFSGALASGLARQLELEACLRLACAAGALATTRLGAQAALPTMDELERFLDRSGRDG